MLHIGSERVRAKFGFACSAAMDQLATIEDAQRRCGESDLVTVTGVRAAARRSGEA